MKHFRKRRYFSWYQQGIKLWQNKKGCKLFGMPSRNDASWKKDIIFGGHFKQILARLISLGLYLGKVWWSILFYLSEDRAKHRFKNKWTLQVVPFVVRTDQHDLDFFTIRPKIQCLILSDLRSFTHIWNSNQKFG